MARIAEEADFHGLRLGAAEPLYDEYRRYPFFAERAAMLHARFPNGNTTILIVGCGKGYLVDELRKLGVSAWGCDVSPWAISEVGRVLPNINSFVRVGDCASAASMAAVRSASLGGPSSRKFTAVVTEDVLPCLTDPEITTTLTAVRSISNAVLHIVSAGNPTDTWRISGLNWKPVVTWKSLCAPDPVYDVERGVFA